jgi:esterase FrsA
VAAIDMPGTGKSRVELSPTADEVLRGATEQLTDRLSAPRTSFFGISFGGHWAAKLALTGRVNAAVDLGGPVGAGGSTLDLAALPNGMAGIVGNAFGLSAPPGQPDLDRFADEFSLRRQGLFDASTSVPLLVINGTDDQYIPTEDTTAFATSPNATVWLVRGATHCAVEHLHRVLPAAFSWTRAQLEPASRTAVNAARIAQLPLTPLLTSTQDAGVREPPGRPR